MVRGLLLFERKLLSREKGHRHMASMPAKRELEAANDLSSPSKRPRVAISDDPSLPTGLASSPVPKAPTARGYNEPQGPPSYPNRPPTNVEGTLKHNEYVHAERTAPGLVTRQSEPTIHDRSTTKTLSKAVPDSQRGDGIIASRGRPITGPPSMAVAKPTAGIGAATVQSKPPGKSSDADKENSKAEDEGQDPLDADEELDIAAIRKHEYDVVSKFSPAQMRRYEQYRRSDLKKEKVKKVLTALHPSLAKASDLFIIAIKGLAKVFVGDVVESALEVQKQWGESGPLQPKHIREAYRILRRDGSIPSAGTQRSLL